MAPTVRPTTRKHMSNPLISTTTRFGRTLSTPARVYRHDWFKRLKSWLQSARQETGPGSALGINMCRRSPKGPDASRSSTSPLSGVQHHPDGEDHECHIGTVGAGHGLFTRGHCGPDEVMLEQRVAGSFLEFSLSHPARSAGGVVQQRERPRRSVTANQRAPSPSQPQSLPQGDPERRGGGLTRASEELASYGLESIEEWTPTGPSLTKYRPHSSLGWRSQESYPACWRMAKREAMTLDSRE